VLWFVSISPSCRVSKHNNFQGLGAGYGILRLDKRKMHLIWPPCFRRKDTVLRSNPLAVEQRQADEDQTEHVGNPDADVDVAFLRHNFPRTSFCSGIYQRVVLVAAGAAQSGQAV
jgi:hypothetical protein